MNEDRSARGRGCHGIHQVDAQGHRCRFALVRRSRVLRALVAVELFWGFGMIAFESLMPVRMSELLGDRDDAAAVMGPIVAAAWGISAVGALVVPLLLRRWSMRSVSFTLRIVQGVTVVAMGLAIGPSWLGRRLLRDVRRAHRCGCHLRDDAARAGWARAARDGAVTGVDGDAPGGVTRRDRARRDRHGRLDRYGDDRRWGGAGPGRTVVPGATRARRQAAGGGGSRRSTTRGSRFWPLT